MAQWTAAEMNDLPDSSFLYVEKGGSKDSEGKTVPRSMRHFPVKDKNGKVDIAHVRNAMTRIPQSDAPGLTDEMKGQLQEKCRKMLEEDGQTMMDNAVTCSVDLFPNSETAAPSGEKWIQVAVVGEWKGHPAGPEVITPERIRSMAEFFRQRYAANATDLVIDYVHQSMLLGQDAPAAGWIHAVEPRNDAKGLWALVRWNGRASEMLARREYRYLSPVFRFDYADPVSGRKWPAILDSVALTNKPFMTELPAVANSDGAAEGTTKAVADQEDRAMEKLLVLLSAALSLEPKVVANAIGVQEDAKAEDLVKGLAALYRGGQIATARLAVFANAIGVPPDATDKALGDKVAELKAPATAVAVIANSLGVTPDAKPEEMAKQIADLRSQAQDNRAEQLVANAVAGKKIPPALKDWWVKQAKADLAGTTAIVNALPAILSDPSKTAGAAPGAGDLPPDQAFANSTALQEEFGNVEAYKAYCKAEKEGRVKRLSKAG